MSVRMYVCARTRAWIVIWNLKSHQSACNVYDVRRYQYFYQNCRKKGERERKRDYKKFLLPAQPNAPLIVYENCHRQSRIVRAEESGVLQHSRASSRLFPSPDKLRNFAPVSMVKFLRRTRQRFAFTRLNQNVTAWLVRATFYPIFRSARTNYSK